MVKRARLTEYVLPLRWSLYYALTDSQWRRFRQRHKQLHPAWEKCACPKKCTADTLDEMWEYDQGTHTKIFVGAQFICRGCHWLKTPPLRMKTWLEQQQGSLPALTKRPHIVDCLGWSDDRVDALRTHDLQEHRQQMAQLLRLEQNVKAGQAAFVPAPLEQMVPGALAQFARPGQTLIVPWRVDLSALTRYGYVADQIAAFEKAMYDLARERIFPPMDADGRR